MGPSDPDTEPPRRSSTAPTEHIPGSKVLDCPVTAITQSDDGVTVTAAATITAAKAVVTVPPPIAAKIAFQPHARQPNPSATQYPYGCGIYGFLAAILGHGGDHGMTVLEVDRRAKPRVTVGSMRHQVVGLPSSCFAPLPEGNR
ncbi:FAD-dependent oxidoreductase [Gordonia rhizosphera]|uniref:FAD-dependent oxidoreductase n=1 Tax=Gordonia rhizosphera TaxID=83341 RepID=UPI0012F6DEDE|nr:FAD-dependent oxidoreductase [Gordonia rhizosphera]